ncbi:hypothetical protein B0H15DRAFT_205877 [Mycena belliarum]|uniref:Uncharacterized protein n=1 Tax=Mycena belliarum TaxID=1033014 RepID=A0AAD6UP61_9AGAR|nr:hypothetical protein B0H15DRAFT_205877 [Mycena belliae]
MPKAATSRHPLPTSSTDFNLPPSSAPSTPVAGYLDENLLFQRFRRPSLLAPKAHLPDSRLHSPLAASFKSSSSHKRRASYSTSSLDESDALWSDITPPSSSENTTPPLLAPENPDDSRRSVPPLTPPRRSLSRGADLAEARFKGRRLSFPLKQPRILNLLSESRPIESEVQSEAAFQRLLASGVELPRTPRTVADRGRYPEEAGHEEFQREDTPSDDGEDNDSTYTPFYPVPNGSEPINIRTPAGSVNGDDINTMCISESPSLSGMDVDVPSGSPSMSSMSSMSISHWRSTPPPTTSAVRSNKRKFDERFDPYQNASKRRAVSPSLSHLRDSHPSSPKTRSNTRLPIAIPIMPASAASSTTSSPTVGVSAGAAFLSMSRPVNGISSPTMRASMGLASPILRPIPRSATGFRRGEGEEREIEGAGEGVGGLTLGS